MNQTTAKPIAVTSKNDPYFARWIGFLLALSLLVVFQFASAATTAAIAKDTVPADQVLSNQNFDHTKTGYILTGAHYTARCATCHINGVLKGTPRDCATCHVVGNRMAATAKPVNHIITQDKCDTCHKTNLWTPAQFSHVGIIEGTCATCHNGSTSTGKPRNHLQTSTSCDGCHKTIDWLQVTFSHKNITSGCGDCHSAGSQQVPGMNPLTKPANHMDTMGLDCASCHYTTSFVSLKPGTPQPPNHLKTNLPCAACHNPSGFIPGIMNHTGIFTGCADCHNGQSFLGVTALPKPSNHYPTTLVSNGNACETCHSATRTNVGDFTPADPKSAMNHVGVINQCSTCHTGTPLYANTYPIVTNSDALALQKFSGHANTASDCSQCHSSTTTFSGGSTTQIPANHLPTTKTCVTCHSAGYGTNQGVMGLLGHDGATTCTVCHGDGNNFIGGPFKSKADAVPTHIGTSADCSTCHLPSTFTAGGFKGASGGTTLPANHVPTTLSCSGCHTSGFGVGSGLTGGNMAHTGIATGCASCHNGNSYYGVKPKAKSSTHYPTTTVANGSACETCHLSSRTLIGDFLAGKSVMNHTGITGNCASCHDGNPAYANSYPIVTKASYSAGHMTTSSDCSKCHANTTSFTGGVSTEMPANHIPTATICTVCHTSGFGVGSGLKASGAMVHTGAETTVCATCHNGTTYYGPTKPLPKSITHQATSLDCSSCHLPSTYAIGGFAGASGGTLPNNHVPTTQSCSLCHISGTGPGSGVMKHNGIVTGCTTCHNNTAFLGVTPVFKSSNHVPTTSVTLGSACETCHSTTIFTSFSAIAAVTTMKHNGISTGCATCHSGTAYAAVTPVSKATNHLPTSTVPNGANCETCHSAINFTTFSATKYHTKVTVTTGCSSCHGGQAYQGVTPLAKSSKHINYASGLLGGSAMQCELCHKSTATGGFMTYSVTSSALHNGSQGMGSGSCVVCHLSGVSVSATGIKQSKHNSASATKDCSSSSCHKPLGKEGTAYSSW